MAPDHSSLHHAILSAVIERGFAPSRAQLAAGFGCTDAAMALALRALADYHGVVLHPASGEVWVIHPFAAAPTDFVVRSGQGSWFGNCAWCALGAAQLLGGTATITTALGAEAEQVCVRVSDGRLLDEDYVVHFPVPMARAWDNVIYTCSMQLLFRTPADVDGWCRRHGAPRGDVRPIGQIWEFAREWYGRHLEVDWRKWTQAEAAAIFRRHGLTGPVWDLEAVSGRF
jgi:hypothetical protein